MEPLDLMDELEREIENPLEPPNLAFEDPLSQMQSILETQMENTVEYKPTTPRTLPPVTPLEEPESARGVRSPDPPPVEYGRTGLYQPSLPGFGRIRSSHAGIRNSQDVYCEREGRRRDHRECINNECPDWDSELQICRYGDEEWKKSEENEN